MKCCFFLLMIFIVNTISNAQANFRKGKFTLNGKIIGREKGYVHLIYLKNEKDFHDSCRLKDGKFVFEGFIQEPSMAFLYYIIKSTNLTDSNSINIFLDPTVINAVFKVDDLGHGKVTGSISNNELKSLRLEQDIVVEKWSSESDRAFYLAAIDSVRYHFIMCNPNSYVSGYALQLLKLNTDSLKMCIAAMNPRIRRSSRVLKIKSRIENIEKSNVTIGKMAPNFTHNSVDDDKISLQDFRGTIVLLNFWASWCIPCREENSSLVKIFNYYKSRGFVVLGFSLDNLETEKAWRTAIEKDGLEWPQVSDLKGRESVVAQQYNVREIPSNFLIDKNGAIISLNLSMEKLKKKLEELLGY